VSCSRTASSSSLNMGDLTRDITALITQGGFQIEQMEITCEVPEIVDPLLVGNSDPEIAIARPDSHSRNEMSGLVPKALHAILPPWTPSSPRPRACWRRVIRSAR